MCGSNIRMQWIDVDDAFEEGLQTSAIINLDYKDSGRSSNYYVFQLYNYVSIVPFVLIWR